MIDQKFESIKNEVEEINPKGKFYVVILDENSFKKHAMPLVRIKRIMKHQTGVKYVAGETPILFSKACELFIIDMAHRAWIHTLNKGRKTMQVNLYLNI